MQMARVALENCGPTSRRPFSTDHFCVRTPAPPPPCSQGAEALKRGSPVLARPRRHAHALHLCGVTNPAATQCMPRPAHAPPQTCLANAAMRCPPSRRTPTRANANERPEHRHARPLRQAHALCLCGATNTATTQCMPRPPHSLPWGNKVTADMRCACTCIHPSLRAEPPARAPMPPQRCRARARHQMCHPRARRRPPLHVGTSSPAARATAVAKGP